MNANKIVMVALALCLCFTAVSAVGQYYESKYSDVKGAPVYETGTLMGNIRCGYNTLTPEVGIRNDLTPNLSFKMFPIKPDGTFEVELIPGSFTIMLIDGNGGQPEYSHTKIVAGQISRPETQLLGHAVTAWDVPEEVATKSTDRIHVFWATYGMYKRVCEPVKGYQSCHWEGGFAVVQDNIQAVVDMGATSFVFDNGRTGDYTGGIWSTDGVLLNSIDDPARDLVKKVYIAYYKNGVIKFRNAMEGQTITL